MRFLSTICFLGGLYMRFLSPTSLLCVAEVDHLSYGLRKKIIQTNNKRFIWG